MNKLHTTIYRNHVIDIELVQEMTGWSARILITDDNDAITSDTTKPYGEAKRTLQRAIDSAQRTIRKSIYQ